LPEPTSAGSELDLGEKLPMSLGFSFPALSDYLFTAILSSKMTFSFRRVRILLLPPLPEEARLRHLRVPGGMRIN
jgi:hypothetical protein